MLSLFFLMDNHNLIKDDRYSSGRQLADQGIKSVAKVSLWKSQVISIKELFEYSENQSYKWNWSETQYSATEDNVSAVEVSFVYFLKTEEVEKFKSIFPLSLLHLLRFETFNPVIYDYYDSKIMISKHPQTP